ncbi:MAG: VOC family protein [Candidatus Nanopelagicales bacterium]|jgi:catechol 2,3-dioxygenase-like lactoylglutathione lyase family enzyme|nr:VOC family protein [Candidatus Nanopelagicales bacterium]
MTHEGIEGWVQRVFAVTLIVEELDAAREFYGRAFELPEHYYSGDSAVYRFGDLLINLLEADKGPGLLDPVPVAPPEAGVRVQLTVPVDDVDAVAAGLVARGVDLLRGPEDRPWGPRTASFRDPAGHVWEIAQR